MVTGPKRDDDEDGPEEFHLVVVDNGRSNLLKDPALRESLYCIRCGACLNVCPVYQRVGGHAYGWVYPGPIGSIVTPALVGVAQAKDLPNASTLCGACRDACPVQINIPRMLLHLRHQLAESPDPQQRTASDRDVLMARGFAKVMSSPALLRLSRRFGRVFLRAISKGGRVGPTGVPFLSRWTRARDLPVPRRSARSRKCGVTSCPKPMADRHSGNAMGIPASWDAAGGGTLGIPPAQFFASVREALGRNANPAVRTVRPPDRRHCDA